MLYADELLYDAQQSRPISSTQCTMFYRNMINMKDVTWRQSLVYVYPESMRRAQYTIVRFTENAVCIRGPPELDLNERYL